MSDELRSALEEGERQGRRYALALPRRAARGAAGGALTSQAGRSLEFKDHRAYEPGDDPRHIDWNAYARSDQLTVKVYREEVHPHVEIAVDGSRSMALNAAKAAATAGLAALLAAAAANAGCTHTGWLLGAEPTPLHGPPSAWSGVAFEHAAAPTAALARAAPGWKPRGVRVLLSDLLWEEEPGPALRRFADRAAAAVVVQVLARADAEPPEEAGLRLTDAETGEALEVYVDAGAARRYREALARHQEGWRRACRGVGAVLTTVVAESVLRDWRLDELAAAEVLRVV
jgi:uncharacterized protein (DUF58 family)